jgi:hypothetical protein
MPVHDWTLVEAGIYHAFHVLWIPEICKTLNEGLLPDGYYALPEQHAGYAIPDVLTLHASPPSFEPPPLSPTSGGTAVAEVPPRVRRTQVVTESLRGRRRTLAIRHVSGHRLVAMIEILSPANKDRAESVHEFATKAVSALELGVHLLLVDLFPPGPHDPHGMHGAILALIDDQGEPYDLPRDEPLTLASYAAGPRVEAYLEHLAVGAPLPEMPLFLNPDRYINVPLEPTYLAAYRGMPAFWRDVLEGRTPQG